MIAVTTGLSKMSMTNLLGALNKELKTQNRELAASCAGQVLLKYAFDRNYRGGETLLIDNTQCAIQPFSAVTQDLTTFTVLVTANQISTALETTVKRSDLSLISQHEIINNL
jgi:hypothetical protein